MPIVLGSPADLTLSAYRQIAEGKEKVALRDDGLDRVERSRALFLKHLESGPTAYGVTTGLGAMAGYDLDERERALLPRHVLLGRAAAVGPPFSASEVRGSMLIRLAQWLSGASAVSADLCRFMVDRLNDGFVPYVPSEGLGMAGEIIPLSHLAQTFIGEGFILGDGGDRVPAADWFAARGIAPYEPKTKEGLSLISGVALAPTVALRHGSSLRRTLALATLTAAAAIEGIAASVEAYSLDVAALRPDPGLSEIGDALRALLAGSEIERETRQPPISFRVVPQVHGSCLTAIRRLEDAAVSEFTAVGDNPAFIGDEDSPAFGRLVHGGNFHCAELTAAVEGAALAASQVALLSERRLHRLLDTRFSGLPHQLARRPGLDAGLVILQKAVLGLTAKIRSLSVPPSLQHGESSFGQEDVMTMVFPALDRLTEIDRLTRLAATYELYAALVAIDERGKEPGKEVAEVLARVRTEIPAYHADRPYGPDIERLAVLIEAGRLRLLELA
jgi:histidine ammonia-lyase